MSSFPQIIMVVYFAPKSTFQGGCPGFLSRTLCSRQKQSMTSNLAANARRSHGQQLAITAQFPACCADLASSNKCMTAHTSPFGEIQPVPMALPQRMHVAPTGQTCSHAEPRQHFVHRLQTTGPGPLHSRGDGSGDDVTTAVVTMSPRW